MINTATFMLNNTAVDFFYPAQFVLSQHSQPEIPIFTADDFRIRTKSMVAVDVAMNKIANARHKIAAGNALDLLLESRKPRPIHQPPVVIYKLVKVMKTLALWVI